mgnify:CR=1 FL=1
MGAMRALRNIVVRTGSGIWTASLRNPGMS